MNALDNFIKGPLTSIFGLVCMGTALFGWWTDWLTDWQGGGLGIIGLTLLFVKDKLPDFISQIFNALISKFSNKTK